MRPELSCDDALRYLQLRLDGRLGAAEGVTLAAHLEECAGCRAEAAGFEGLSVLWRGREMVTPPADLAARVMAQLSERAPARRPSLLAPVLAASGGMLLLLAWFVGELAAPATTLLEGLLNTATALWSDPLALWNVAPELSGAGLAMTLEVLLAAGLGLALLAIAGLLAFPSAGRQMAPAMEGAS